MQVENQLHSLGKIKIKQCGHDISYTSCLCFLRLHIFTRCLLNTGLLHYKHFYVKLDIPYPSLKSMFTKRIANNSSLERYFRRIYKLNQQERGLKTIETSQKIVKYWKTKLYPERQTLNPPKGPEGCEISKRSTKTTLKYQLAQIEHFLNTNFSFV